MVEVHEGHHHEINIKNEIYELVNVDMEGRLVLVYGPTFRNTSED